MKQKSLLLTLLVMFATVLTAQVQSGNIYRIVNAKYGSVISASPHSHTLSCVSEGTNEDYQQLWKIEQTSNGKYTIQNVYSRRYLQNQTGTNKAYYTGPSMTAFAITENPNLKGCYNIDASGRAGGWGLHCASGNTVVPWSYGTTEVTGTEWKFQEVTMTEEELETAFADYQELEKTSSNLGAIQSKAMGFFADKTGTTLKEEYAQMSDEELTAAVADLPKTLQNAILKIKNNSWDETTREKDFRVYDYRPYSDPVAWADKLYVRYYNRVNNPTGICSNNDRDFLYIFVDNIPAKTTVYLTEVAGTAYFGTDTKLYAGLNIIPSAMKDGVLYIRYNCETDPAGKKLADYPNLKVHIEGGYVNGFWSKERRHTNDDWAYMQQHMFRNENAIQVSGDYALLSFRKKEFLQECPTNIEGIINLWDYWNKTQQKFMAIDKYYEWFNNKQLAMSDDGGFMDAGNWRTHYNNNTLNTIVNYDRLIADAGSSWGPNHEVGHNNQYAFEIVGTSEVSNNALANMVIFEQGTHTSRGNDLQNQILGFENKLPYVVRGEKKYGQQLFSMTRMYFQLFLYFHAAGKNPNFYPTLFEELRKDRLIGWGTGSDRSHGGGECNGDGYHPTNEYGYVLGSMDATHDQLKFAEKCCSIAQMDLTEFFEAWGFFIPMKNAYVGDYGHHHVYLTQGAIDSCKARIKAANYPKKGGHLMFLEDRVRPSKKKVSPFSDGKGNRADYSDEVPVGDNNKVKVGYYGQWEDYIDESVKAEGYYYAISNNKVTITEVEGAKGALGFKLYNADTDELLTYTNLREMKVPMSAINANLKVVAAQADGTDYVVPHASQGPEDLQLQALYSSLLNATSVKGRKATTGTEIGNYYPEALAELESLYNDAKRAYDKKDTSVRSYAEWSVMLDDMCSRIKENPKNQVQFEENTTAYLTCAGTSAYRALAVVWGSTGLVAKTSKNISNDTPEKQWMIEYAGKEGEYYIKNGNGYYISEFVLNETVQADVTSTAAAAKFNIVFENGKITFPLISNNSVTFGITGNKVNGEYTLYGMSTNSADAQWNGFVIEDNSAVHYKNELANALKEAKILVTEIINMDSINTRNFFNESIVITNRNLETYALELYNKYNEATANFENAETHKAYLTDLRNLFNKIEGTYRVAAPIVTKGEQVVWYRLKNKSTGSYMSISTSTTSTNKNRLAMVSVNKLSDASLWSFASTGVKNEYKLYNAEKNAFVYEGKSSRLYAADGEEALHVIVKYDETNEAMTIMSGSKYFFEKSEYVDLNRSASYWTLEIADIEKNKEVADIITVIESVEADAIKNGDVYDMQGRKVTAPTKGMYIVNGKKVMVK